MRTPTPFRSRPISWLFVGLSLLIAHPAPADSLADRLDAALRSRELRGARIAALVVNARSGAVLYEHSPDRALTPASNVKVLTALAALATFGPTHRFETRIDADAPPADDGAVRTLVVRGGGDPALNSEDWWRLAADLRRTRLRRVTERLVLDDSAFDRERWRPSWGVTSARAYHAPVGALTANYGAFAVTVFPGDAPGESVRAMVDPPVSYLRLVNRARTGPRSKRRSVIVDRRASGSREIVSVDGAMRLGDPPKTWYRSVLDPTRYAASVFRMQLAAVGIEVAGETRVGAAPEATSELLLYEGRPLGEIVRLFTKYSNNAVAETLVKAMGVREGGAGSWDAGLAVMRKRLLELGLAPDSFHLVDGSGLSYENKVTPRALVTALQVARRSFDFGPELVAALPIAAQDGTLEERAEQAAGAVRAKTGLLNRVTALSGFARLPRDAAEGVRPDDQAIFSIIVNGYRRSDEEAMTGLDRFVAELAIGPKGRAQRAEGERSSVN